MSKDVAQRDIDMAGFRVFNVGPPQAAGDATHVDSEIVPLPASGPGGPGQSLLAAPADHVHPEVHVAVVLQVESEKGGIVTGPVERLIFQRLVDFSSLNADSFNTVFSGFVSIDAGDTGTFNVRLGGTFLNPDGDIIATIVTQSPATDPAIAVGSPALRPSAPTLVKVTAATDGPTAPTATARIDNIRITMAS